MTNETLIKESPYKVFWSAVLAMLVVEVICFVSSMMYKKYKDGLIQVAKAELLVMAAKEESLAGQKQPAGNLEIVDKVESAFNKLVAKVELNKLKKSV